MRTGFQATTEGTTRAIKALAKKHGWVLEDPNTYADGDTELLEMWAEDGIVFVSIPDGDAETLEIEGFVEIESEDGETRIEIEAP